MGQHVHPRRRRATYEDHRIVRLPGDLLRPGLLLSAFDLWTVRRTAAVAQLDRAA